MKSSLEKDVLRFSLLLGIGYQLYQSILSIFPTLVWLQALVNILISVFSILLYFNLRHRKHVQFIAFMVHLLALIGFTFFWVGNGGLAGTVPSFLCFYISFIVTVSHGYFRIISLTLLSGLVASYFLFPEWFGMSSYEEPIKISFGQKSIDYVVIGGIISLFALYVKQQFTHYREQSNGRNEQLMQSVKTLASQNQELALREEETRAINDNLEAMVENRTREARMKSEALEEFAFINAHTIRGPLCRIAGILQLMERETDKYDVVQLNRIKQITREIDDQIQAINKVISS